MISILKFSATCVVIMTIVFIGTSFESKMQLILLVILTISIADYFIGTLLPVTDNQLQRGITGYASKFKIFIYYQLVQGSN